MWAPRGLPFGEIGACRLVRTRSRCSPKKGGNSLGGRRGSLILAMPVSGAHIDLDQLIY